MEILTIGREILDGRVIDTNSVWLAEQLKEIGLVPRYAQRVDDGIDRVVEAYRIAGSRSDVIVTGGLGPTADDLTAEAFAKFQGEELVLNAEALRQIEAFFEKIGRKIPAEVKPQQHKQAYFPPLCEILENTEGTAPGFALRGHSGKRWFFMPGVPKEMKAMFLSRVSPELPKVEGYRSSTWATQFTSEGELQSKLNPVHRALPAHFEITYRTRFPENHVGLHALCAGDEDRHLYERFAAEIEAILGKTVFSGGLGKSVQELETVVVELLSRKGRVIGSVESCTGGLIANRVTNGREVRLRFGARGLSMTIPQRSRLAWTRDSLRSTAPYRWRSRVRWQRRGWPSSSAWARPSRCACRRPESRVRAEVPTKSQSGSVMSESRASVRRVEEEFRGRVGLKRAENKLLFSQKALDGLRLSLLE